MDCKELRFKIDGRNKPGLIDQGRAHSPPLKEAKGNLSVDYLEMIGKKMR